MAKVLGQEALRVLRGIARELGLIIREFVLALIYGERRRRSTSRRSAANSIARR